jgi:ribosomal protein S18 acetylase RimI-like enzyme
MNVKNFFILISYLLVISIGNTSSITLEWSQNMTDADLELSYRTYGSMKQNYSDLKIDYDNFLRDYHEEMKKSLGFEGNDNIKSYFVRALCQGESSGFAYFKHEKNSSNAYLEFLAVDPAYKRQGIGKHLAYSIFSLLPEVTEYTLDTRIFNEPAHLFYPKIGCVLESSPKEGYHRFRLQKVNVINFDDTLAVDN